MTNGSRVGGWFKRWWPFAIDFALTLWVLRAPLAAVSVGFVLLGMTPQAQDLLVELATPGGFFVNWLRIAVFYALLLFVWAMPTHYAARLLVNTDERYNKRIAQRNSAINSWLKTWAPRILGTLTFVAMLIAAFRSQRNLPHVADNNYDHGALTLRLLLIAAAIAALGGVFLAYAIYRDRLAGHPVTQRLEAALAVPMAPIRLVSPRVTAADTGAQSNLGPLLLVAMTAAFVLLPLFVPEFFAGLFPRASSVPFIVGGWLPLLAYLTALGRRWQVPFVFLIAVILVVLPYIFGDNYRVRIVDPAAQVEQLTGPGGPSIQQITVGLNIEDAVAMWKAANSCAQGPCPRPIIVAAAGGASRAGFFTAGFIGQLLDDQLRPDDQGHGLAPHDVINRIFALSTVSGSSVGAVMTVAAMGASDTREPCTAKSDRLWRGRAIDSWRSCLEALMSGDFLTAAFTGFAFRDLFGFLHLMDRATLLERSWEAHFSKLIGGKPRRTASLACSTSLECPFMTLRPSQDQTSVHWLPLLLLNGTSVGTGQRIITTVLDADFILKNDMKCPLEPRARIRCPLFSSGRLFHNYLIADRTKLKDLRLSTAALNSARFPLVSPPGEVTDGGGNIVDRIVDGGYFENFGAQTATELAQAMRVIDPNLDPFVLVLSNDPQVPEGTAPPDAVRFGKEGAVLTDINAPITAFSNTRNARGTLAVDDAGATLDRFDSRACNLALVQVWGEPLSVNKESPDYGKVRPLSLSWWLSKPVQAYLHEQTDYIGGKPVGEFSRNRRVIGYLLNALKWAPELSPAGAPAPPCLQVEDGTSFVPRQRP